MIIINVETTSIKPEDGSIIEIAGLLINGKNDYEPLFNYIVKPRNQINGNEWIFKNNLYLKKAIKFGVEWNKIKDDIQYWFNLLTVTAWNSKFDFDWLENYGLIIPNKGKDLKKKNISLQSHICFKEYPCAILECFWAATTIWDDAV